MNKFCNSCGTQLPYEGGGCPNCSPTNKPFNERTVGEIGRSFGNLGNSVSYNAQNEAASTIKLGGSSIALATAIKVIAGVLCVLFFLPFTTFILFRIQFSFSGWEVTFGKYINDFGRTDGNAAGIFLLLIPAAMFIAIQFRDKISFVKDRMFITSSVLSVMGLLGLVIFSSEMNKMIHYWFGSISRSNTIWFYLSIILYIVAGAVSVKCVHTAKKSTQQHPGANQHNNTNWQNPVQAHQLNCPSCGNANGNGIRFCVYCGANL